MGGTLGVAARPIRATAWKAAYGPFSDGGVIVTIEEVAAASKAAHGEVTAFPAIVGADTTNPLINVAVHPVPSGTPGTLELIYYTAIPQFAALTTTLASVGFPDEWEELLYPGYALALLPRYGRQGYNPEALVKKAQLAQDRIAALNQPTPQQAAA